MLKFSIIFVLFLVPTIFAESISLTDNDLTNEISQELLDVAEDDVFASSFCNLSYACYKKRSYYFETKHMRTYDNATTFCRAINMSLVSVENCDENTFITNLIKDNQCYGHTFWTSGYRYDTEIFYWAGGIKIEYKNWMRAEPNYGDNQYCVAYHRDFVQWSDRNCNDKYYFICESNNACA